MNLIAGWYWIDPNLGMSDDAVFVYCNITGSGETCVFPDMHSSHMPNIPWRKEGDKNDWYSNLRGGFRVSTNFAVITCKKSYNTF
jgi:collagen type V/XI/XXIV/XXVII alpha